MKQYIIQAVLTIVVFLFLFLACNSRGLDTATVFQEKLNNLTLIDSLDDRIKHHGDTAAYRQLRMIHYMAQQRQGFLYYAFIMSNKYGYDLASYDVYFILSRSDSTLDSTSTKMANYYLEKSGLANDELREFR